MSILSSARDLSSFVVNGEAEVQDMDYQVEWLVENPEKEHRLIVDSQSFINGIRYERFIENRFQGKWMIYIDGEACVNFVMFGRELIDQNGNFCLIADHQNKNVEILKDLRFCR